MYSMVLLKARRTLLLWVLGIGAMGESVSREHERTVLTHDLHHLFLSEQETC